MTVAAGAEAAEPRGFAFPKSLHVRKDREFRRIYRQGSRARGPYLSIVVWRNRLGHSRLGLSVSKKLGNAVRRNRIKRMVREAYRLVRWEIEARAGGVDIVVIPNLPQGHYPLAALMDELPLLVEKAATRHEQKRRERRDGGGRSRRGGRRGRGRERAGSEGGSVPGSGSGGGDGKKPRARESERS